MKFGVSTTSIKKHLYKYEQAILLRRINFRESSLIVHLLTNNNGVISLLAKGGRRANSPFRAILEPLHFLHIEYKDSRTGDMGIILHADRQVVLVNDVSQYALGLKYTAIASSLLRQEHYQALAAYLHGINLLLARPKNYALTCSIWYLLSYCGWIGSLEQCWQCTRMTDIHNKDIMFWHDAQLLCHVCVNDIAAKKIELGLRRSIKAVMDSSNIRLHDRYICLWKSMVNDVLQLHGVKNTLINNYQ
ncbi:MAG: recombination protein O N-terminal domain-containing protein [Mariprofundales bacterium]